MTMNSALVERGAATSSFSGDVEGSEKSSAIVEDGTNESSGGALILGGAHGSLSVARSLGRRGIPVWLVSNELTIARFSRYVKRNLSWCGPNHPDAAAELLDIARHNHLDGWVLIPGADSEARVVSQNKSALTSMFRLKTPAWEKMKWAYDKKLTYERAALLGIGFPLSYNPRGHQDVVQLDCRFPLVLKPTVRERKNAFTRAKAWRVDNRAALIARYDEAFALVGAGGIVVQELIPGGGSAQFSYAAVWDRGAPIASLVARRRRQLPIDFGLTSTFVETIENDDIEAAAIRFLKAIDYSGLVEVEFKYDCRDGRYKILDVNARSWTWCALGGLAGVDFPYILWRLAMGEEVPPSRGKPGMAWILAARDVMAASQEILAGIPTPIEYLRSLHGPIVFGAYADDDKLPGVIELPLSGWRHLKRCLSR